MQHANCLTVIPHLAPAVMRIVRHNLCDETLREYVSCALGSKGCKACSFLLFGCVLGKQYVEVL